MCPENARLHRVLWELSTIIPKGMPAEKAHKIIEMDRNNPDYQAAIEAIRLHNRSCEICQEVWN